jgi:hypothetical protein
LTGFQPARLIREVTLNFFHKTPPHAIEPTIIPSAPHSPTVIPSTLDNMQFHALQRTIPSAPNGCWQAKISQHKQHPTLKQAP